MLKHFEDSGGGERNFHLTCYHSNSNAKTSDGKPLDANGDNSNSSNSINSSNTTVSNNDDNDHSNDTNSMIDNVYDQSIDDIEVLPLPQVQAIRTISAQVVEELSEKLKTSLINDIKHMVASEIQQNNKENVHGHRSTSPQHERATGTYPSNYTQSFSRSRNDYQFHDVSNPINNTDRYNNPKVPSLQFENLNQFLQDARHYLTNELLMGGISGNKDSKKIHRTAVSAMFNSNNSINNRNHGVYRMNNNHRNNNYTNHQHQQQHEFFPSHREISAEKLLEMLNSSYGYKYTHIPFLTHHNFFALFLKNLIHEYGNQDSIQGNKLQHRFCDYLNDFYTNPLLIS